MFALVHFSRPSCSSSNAAWCGHQVRLSPGASTPARPHMAGNEMGRLPVCRWHAPLWPPLGPKHFLSHIRHPGMVYSQKRGQHFIDDFIVLGHPGSDSCARSLHTLESMCAALATSVSTRCECEYSLRV